ncbi:hypothetical protein N657DRAFT_651475 [Parathielavia appendiculata]|uniref:Uncharacterized protein n=1 Tax=Parathielavia appendiculata TaxID=2587402 RepID=A0AAN6TPI2_9PEZI|nr:hypothetical protein N657DRAFT_651475 [Parathielavia appendiculata]
MGESRNQNAKGLLFCPTGNQSQSCTANGEDPGLADGLGETADVRSGQEAGAGARSLIPVTFEGQEAFPLCICRIAH